MRCSQRVSNSDSSALRFPFFCVTTSGEPTCQRYVSSQLSVTWQFGNWKQGFLEVFALINCIARSLNCLLPKTPIARQTFKLVKLSYKLIYVWLCIISVGKVILKNQLDATITIYWSPRSTQHDLGSPSYWTRSTTLPLSKPLPTTTTGHYIICCKSQSYASDVGQKIARNMLS